MQQRLCMSLIVTKQSRQQCEARRRAEIEEKHMQDKLKKLEEDKENLTREKNELTKEKTELTKEKTELAKEKAELTKEKTKLHIKLQTEISETEKWKAKYEQLLAAQSEKKN